MRNYYCKGPAVERTEVKVQRLDPEEEGFISCWTVLQSSRPERLQNT